MTPERFLTEFDVPRGTVDALTQYETLLKDWQTRMNLVGPATLEDVWNRHFLDSAQLSKHVPKGMKWLDIGAGGGFPGLVLAAMRWGDIVAIDSIQKKCRFLETVSDEIKVTNHYKVICSRVEDLPTLGVDVVTARAAASLVKLMDWGIRHVRPGGMMLFPKGRKWQEEVAEAEENFIFDLETFPSVTDPEARILRATNVKRI